MPRTTWWCTTTGSERSTRYDLRADGTLAATGVSVSQLGSVLILTNNGDWFPRLP